MSLFGIHLVGFTTHTFHKLLLSVGLVLALVALRYLLTGLFRLLLRGHRSERVVFWIRQGLNLGFLLASVIGIVSIWVDNPAQLATGAGLLTAGVAFALQKVITAFAGYIVIMRGKTFSVGDRITMGGVRGDVISLGFIQTRVMEMGEPPSITGGDAKTWVHGRQYTGRIVTITNDKVFDEPVYNYTREFPYLWEELRLPIRYQDDRARVERILLEAAHRFTARIEHMSHEARQTLEHKYFIDLRDTDPRVYYRLTDNWVELALRYLVPERGVREINSEMSRFILAELDRAGIGIASSTYDVVGFPPLKLDPEFLALLRGSQENRRASGR